MEILGGGVCWSMLLEYCMEILGGGRRAKACEPPVNQQPTWSQDKILQLDAHQYFAQPLSSISLSSEYCEQLRKTTATE